MFRIVQSSTIEHFVVSPDLLVHPLYHLISNLDHLFHRYVFINRSNTLENGDGGAISLRLGSSATLFSGCLFSDNLAVNGGAMSGDFATATLHSSTMHFNEATGNVSVPFILAYIVGNDVSIQFYLQMYFSLC